MPHHHPDHSTTIKRLNRIEGQISGVRKMIEDRRYCLDILAQTKSVQSALKSLEAEILSTHLEHCVNDALLSGDKKESQAKISEIIQIFKRG